MQVYTKDYLQKYEPTNETFTERNKALARAKELRRQGFTIKVKKWDFTDLARATCWEVSGQRERSVTK